MLLFDPFVNNNVLNVSLNSDGLRCILS